MKKCLWFLLILVSVSLAVAQNPACQTAHHRAFDFWLGNWRVLNPQGKLAGHNQIEVMQDGCVLQENWRAANGVYTGTSYNFYNSGTGLWYQTWVDNQGGVLLLQGGIQNGAMVLEGKSKNAQGQWQLDRITWTPHNANTVQQLWTVSVDEGKTWTTLFDGTYQRE